MAEKKSPDPVDRHVGMRVRMRRMLVGMSQEKLGESLGITFQQVQKYEKGTNRISASRLQQIAETLNVPVDFFFAGAPAGPVGAGQGLAEGGGLDNLAEFLARPDAIQLMKAFLAIEDPALRKRIVDLVSTLSGEGSRPAAPSVKTNGSA